jgi:hypothetical protein
LIDAYDWARGCEALLRFGTPGGPRVIASPALFEEANRTRAFLVAILRGLARRGVEAWLPDLPGTGESVIAAADVTLVDWREAYAALAIDSYALSIRGGALMPGLMRGHWQLSPMSGIDVARECRRLSALSEGSAMIPSALVDEIAHAEIVEVSPTRVVRLARDPRPADRVIDAAPLWRRAEPDNDPALADELAQDVADWIKQCGG